MWKLMPSSGEGNVAMSSCQDRRRALLIIRLIAIVATTMVKGGAFMRGLMSPRSKTIPTNAMMARLSNRTCQYGEMEEDGEEQRDVGAKRRQLAVREIEDAGALEREHQSQSDQSVYASCAQSGNQKLDQDRNGHRPARKRAGPRAPPDCQPLMASHFLKYAPPANQDLTEPLQLAFERIRIFAQHPVFEPVVIVLGAIHLGAIRIAAMLLAILIGIEAILEFHDAHKHALFQQQVDGSPGGGGAGFIRVEIHHDLVRVFPQCLHLWRGQRRSARGHHLAHARGEHADDVHVPFHQHRPVRPADGIFGPVQM